MAQSTQQKEQQQAANAIANLKLSVREKINEGEEKIKSYFTDVKSKASSSLKTFREGANAISAEAENQLKEYETSFQGNITNCLNDGRNAVKSAISSTYDSAKKCIEEILVQAFNFARFGIKGIRTTFKLVEDLEEEFKGCSNSDCYEGVVIKAETLEVDIPSNISYVESKVLDNNQIQQEAVRGCGFMKLETLKLKVKWELEKVAECAKEQK